MEKTIQFGNEELRLRSSLYTLIAYRGVFGSELFDDVKKLDEKETSSTLMLEMIFRLVYIFNKPFSKESYEQFLSKYDFEVLSNSEQLTEVTNTITELLGTVKKAPAGTAHP